MSLRRLSLPGKKASRRVSDTDVRNMKKASETASFVFRAPQKNRSSESKTPKRKHWNRQNEEDVQWIGQRAGGFRYMHGQCAQKYHFLFHLIGVGSIVANTIALGLNVPYVVLCQDNWNWLKITAIIIQAIVTIIMSYQQFKDFGSLRTDHVTSEANYAALYDMIKNELRKDSKHRQDAEHFIEWITKQMSDLKSSSPLIPPKILADYRAMIFGKNIADPEGIDEIIIFENVPEATEVQDGPLGGIDETGVPLNEVVVENPTQEPTQEPTSMIFNPTDAEELERWKENFSVKE